MELKNDWRYINEFENNLYNHYRSNFKKNLKKICPTDIRDNNFFKFKNNESTRNIIFKMFNSENIKNKNSKMNKGLKIIKKKIIKESYKEKLYSFIVKPCNKIYWNFKIVLLIFILYSSIFYSYYISFNINNLSKLNLTFIINIIINLILFVDLILNFFLAFYDKDNILIKDRKKIIWRYLSSWFIIDLFIIFPFNIIHNYLYFDLKLFIYLSKISIILRVIKIYHLKNIIIKYIAIISKPGKDRIIFSYFFLLLLIHSIACLWFIIKNKKAYEVNKNINYLNSMYWAFYTVFSVGYGDIYANSKSEYIFCIIIFIFSMIVNSSIISNVSSITYNNYQDIKKNNMISIMLTSLNKR